MNRSLTFEVLWQRYQFWIELPVVYTIGFMINVFLASGTVHGERGTLMEGVPVIAWILVTFLAPVWVLMWFNIRGKELFVRGRLAYRAAVYLNGNQADGIDAYYIFVLRTRSSGDPDWGKQLHWNDEGYKRWEKALKEAWRSKYGEDSI